VLNNKGIYSVFLRQKKYIIFAEKCSLVAGWWKFVQDSNQVYFIYSWVA